MGQKIVSIIYTGLSVENTPKLKQLEKVFEEIGYKVYIKGIVKYSNDLNVDKNGFYAKGEEQGILKIFKVFYLQIKLFFHLLFVDKSNFYYSINTISGLTVYLVTLFNRKKYIYEAHEMIFGVNYLFFRGKWKKLWNPIEKLIIKNSFWFFTTDAFRLTVYKRYLKIRLDRIGYLMNVPNKFHIEKQNLKTQYGFDNKKIISYCGGVSPSRNIELIIKAYKHLQLDNSILILAGSIESNSYKQKLLNLIEHLELSKESIIITGRLDNLILKEYMALSDVTFTLYNSNSLNNRFSSPNKIFDAIHVGTKFISTDSPLVRDIIKKNSSVGFIVNENNVEDVKEALYKSLALNDEFSPYIYESLKNDYCWENESKKIIEIIKKIV